MAIGCSAPLARSLLYALGAPLVFVRCTFPDVSFGDGGEATDGPIEPAPDAKVEDSEAAGGTDSTIEASEARGEATVDQSATDVAPPREGGEDVAIVDDSATNDASTSDGSSLDVLEPNCDCGPGQSPYATGITCGVLNLGQCNATAGFVDNPACGQEGMWVQCTAVTLLCAPGTPQPKLQQCH